uniref:Uncharacterized protein n=1 Tax=Cannabis sativa TaxID=3483 RepID=A0A803NI03_CANSA
MAHLIEVTGCSWSVVPLAHTIVHLEYRDLFPYHCLAWAVGYQSIALNPLVESSGSPQVFQLSIIPKLYLRLSHRWLSSTRPHFSSVLGIVGGFPRGGSHALGLSTLKLVGAWTLGFVAIESCGLVDEDLLVKTIVNPIKDVDC